MLVRNARPLAVPVVAHSCEHGHHHVLQQLQRTQHRGQPGELLIDGDGVVVAERGDEWSGIDRRPVCRISAVSNPTQASVQWTAT